MASLGIKQILSLASPVLPVLVIDDASDAIELAQSLLDADIRVIEITLRSPAALTAIRLIKQQLPQLIVGAGTVLNSQQLQQATEAGAQFAVSPGWHPELSKQAAQMQLPYLPAVLTPGEIMQAMELGHDCLKLFPANAIDGLALLDSLRGPFAQMLFCPTGGIDSHNLAAYITKKNVICCGGSWLATSELIQQKNWSKIKQLAEQTKAQYETGK